jgi:hypothetical protein
MGQIATPYLETCAKVRSKPTNERTILFNHSNKAPRNGTRVFM